MDPKVILETALNREEITAIESLILMEANPEFDDDLFRVADALNQRLNHNVVTYIRSRRMVYSTICAENGHRCVFHTPKMRRQRFTLTPDQAVSRLKGMNGTREINVNGALNPHLNINYHVRLLRTLKEAYPDVVIHGYSPSEVRFIAKRMRTTPYDILRRLKDAGLDTMPGSSADILNDKLRKKVSTDLIKTHEWVDLIKTAHRLGISTSATILIGHIENNIHVSEHLDIIKNIQKETGGFTSFMPLAYSPETSRPVSGLKLTKDQTMAALIRVQAITRIFFNKLIKNIEMDPHVCGVALTMRGLAAGVNDLGPLVQHTYPDSCHRGSDLTTTAIRNAIIKAGRIPIERNPHRVKAAPSRTAEPAVHVNTHKSLAPVWAAQKSAQDPYLSSRT